MSHLSIERKEAKFISGIQVYLKGSHEFKTNWKMETIIFIPKEEDFRRWIKEEIRASVRELLNELKPNQMEAEDINPLISRADTAKMLGISLVTLTDWVKRGLPRHKQRGRDYFMKSEILDYLKSESGGRTGEIQQKSQL